MIRTIHRAQFVLTEADLLLHIVDISSDTAAQQCHTVEDILKDLGLADKPTLLAFNKIDLLAREIELGNDEIVHQYIDQLGARVKAAAFISASKGWGLNDPAGRIPHNAGTTLHEIGRPAEFVTNRHE
jgi:50S ribosomal subunit-associated GTPase HflX